MSGHWRARRARGLRRQPVPASSADPRDLARAQAVARPRSHAGDQRVAMPQTLFDELFDELSGTDDPQGADAAHDAGTPPLPRDVQASGLPEMDDAERLAAELDILGLDASRHLVEGYRDLLRALGCVDAADLLTRRNQSEVLVAGVKVATQTPAVRSGRRVVFLTLDDATGLSDCTFFEDVQGSCAATVFSSWLLVVRGVVRRTGARGISLRATGAWDLQHLHRVWRAELAATGDRDAALAAVRRELDVLPEGDGIVGEPLGVPGPVSTSTNANGVPPADTEHQTRAGGMGRRRVLVHASGFQQSPYADVQPSGMPAGQTPPTGVVAPATGLPVTGVSVAGVSNPGAPNPGVRDSGAPRKLWHSSPGSSGR